MHTSNHVTQISLVLPGERISQMGARLAHLLEQAESTPGEVEGFGDHERLPWLLHLLGWRTEWQSDGSLKLVEYTGEDLNLERDPVLESAVGCVRAGCFIAGYGEGNAQWQIRYSASSKQQVRGSVVFPRDSEWEQHFRSMLILRESDPADLPQLATLSPRAAASAPERLLVAERGDRIVGFLSYHTEEEGAGVITHIATVVNGRRYGYPQALVAHLKLRYQTLLIRATKRDYSRVWKALGFVRSAPTFEAGDPAVKEYYRWPAPPGEQEAPAQGVEELRRQLDGILLEMSAQEQLPARERSTLQWRLALRDGRWYSLEETARRVGTTRDKAREHQAKALHRLRKNQEALALLRSYLRLASPPLRLRSSISWLVLDADQTEVNLRQISEESGLQD